MADGYRRSSAPLVLAALMLAVLVAAAGCAADRPTAAPAGAPSGAATTAAPPSGTDAPGTGAGAETDAGADTETDTETGAETDAGPDLAAIRATIAEINATAGATVAQQRAALQAAVTPGQAQDERNCPTATSTLAFRPAYRDLRRASGVTDHAGSDTAGTEYLLPALIVIYRGDRIVGNDMTTLRMWVADGVASTAALCVA